MSHPDDEFEVPATVPLVPIKDLVVFPFMIVPLFVSRESSAQAIELALNHTPDRLVFLVTQTDPEQSEPQPDGLHAVGCLGTVMRMAREGGRMKVLVQGLVKARVRRVLRTEPCMLVEPERVDDGAEPPADDVEVAALVRSAKENVERYVRLTKGMPEEIALVIQPVEAPGRLADLVAANLSLEVSRAQDLLVTHDPLERLRKVDAHLQEELGIIEVRQRIESEARREMSRTQREYFLRQQLQAIRTELGDEAADAELERLRERVQQAELPEAAADEARRQIRRLSRLNEESGEAGVIRHFVDWLIAVPWGQATPVEVDLDLAQRVLDEDHYGLDRVKERVLEHLAVRKLRPDARGPILCLAGPPVVGKTSLARSIARATGRVFVSASLGGVRDEAAIRGHRRTYVGALPGRIVQSLRQAGVMNPVFLLDELDKLGGDFRGDPSAALLEVLDPAQNNAFRDHFLDVPVDLSGVLFICTANMVDQIPGPLRDRLEVIHLSGYTEEEKSEIARRHILPRALEDHGLTDQLTVTRAGLQSLIRDYTLEAGLRELDRQLAAICRKVARRVAGGRDGRIRVTPKRLVSLLGPPRPRLDHLPERDEVGVVAGLAWTQAGGSVLAIEATRMPGGTGLRLTGQLGEVMKESAHAALSFLRSRADSYGIDANILRDHEVHVHVPAGAIPKDGPSAGVAIATAMASVLTGRVVRSDVAMTGEVTLRGNILPIGGVKEKVLAATRAGIRTVLLPAGNTLDLRELPASVRRTVELVPCAHVDQVFERALRGGLPAIKPAGVHSLPHPEAR
jgi:ATP-dependent Lon protease